VSAATEKVATVKLGASDHESAEALGVTVSRGYLFWVRPVDDDAIDNSIEYTDKATGETFTESRNWGYHGNDVPPCQGEYVADEEPGSGYLVISDLEEIETVDGWTAERADLDEGWHYAHGASGWRVVVLRRHGRDHEYTICGSL
jgi:hypothetical protein